MVAVSYEPPFLKQISKIADSLTKERILKQIEKIRDNPEIGKPMRYLRKGTREVRILPFRLSYIYNAKLDALVIMELYHKDEQ